MRIALAVCLAGMIAAPAAAIAFEDAASGFAINPPAPFVAQAIVRPQFDVGAGVNPPADDPPRVGAGRNLCEAGFKAAAQNAALTQDRINALTDAPEREATMRSAFGPFMDTLALERITHNGVRGFELVMRPKMGPDAEAVRMYAAVFETPKGRTLLICVTRQEAWERALPSFRAIRDTIKTPG